MDGWMILQVFGILLFIALIFFLAWFITRAAAVNGGFNGKTRHFTVLEKYPLSKDSYLLLLKSFDKLLLVGVTPGGMRVLQEIDPKSADFTMPEDPVQRQSFADVLKVTLGDAFPEGGAVRGAYEKLRGKKKDGGGDA